MTKCYDIDLGYMAVYDDPEEFVQWASGHALDILKLRRRGRSDAADFIEGIVQPVMESHDRDQPRLSARPLIRSFETALEGDSNPEPSDP